MGWDALMVLSAFLSVPVANAFQCGLAEFTCDNGKCISLSRFCDSTDDCGDGSDEIFGCTNCNRSLYGQINQKQPLRITEPFQRYSPFVCNIHFIAAGGDFGDMVELNFLSFQMGALEIGRNQTLVCQKGYMQIVESSSGGDVLRSQQTRGLTQLMSAMGHSAAEQVAERRPIPNFGQFCGEMVGRSVAYYSEGGNISLVVSIPSRASILTYSFSLYLTYKFIRRLPPPQQSDSDEIHFGVRLTDTYCDRVFVNCDRKTCKIRSPNFPGFYLRNITCYYHIKQETNPRGRRARIVFQQVNEYKVSVFTGRTTSGTMNHRVLTSDCLGDVVRIYDGNTTKSPLLTQFCGSGPLPAVETSNPEALVELRSAPYQFLHNSRIELDVSVRYVEETELHMHNGKCEFMVDGRYHRHGIVYSPRHTVPPNTTCVYFLRGKTPHDRVWVTFLSYFVEDKHQWSGVEKCDASRLEIYDAGETILRSRPNASDDVAFAFCEKLSPKICARAAADQAVPIRPCEVTTESYLSSGPEMVLRQLFFRTQELPSRQSNFEARFEFVDTRQDGKPLTDDEMSCDRLFNSSIQTDGSFSSPKNVFLFGRGGRENLTCSYRFEGQPGERVVLRITSYRLRSGHCRHFFDDVTRRHRCHITMRTGQAAILQATEHWGGTFASAAGCLCNQTDEDHGKVITFESVSPKLLLSLTVIGMSPLEDFRDFRFAATYEFANHSLCETSVQRRNGSEGELTFQQFVSRPLRCRWLLQATQGKFLYLKFRGTSSSYGECSSGNRFVVYAGETLQPISSVCVQEGIGAQKFDIFSSSWYNETARGSAQDDLLFVETLGSRPGVFSVKWLEVTRPFLRTQSGKMLRNVNCLFECPELNACISPDLWCDGVTHCPSGYDEARDHCDRFPTLYVAVGAGVGLLLLVALLVILLRRCHRRNKCKVSRPSTTEDFQLECNRF